MPVGIFANLCGVFLGGILGALLKNRIPENLKKNMPTFFGLAAMAIGISLVIKMKTLPAVILSIVVGSICGELLHLEERLNALGNRLQKRFFPRIFRGAPPEEEAEKNSLLVVVVVLFCFSGSGIFGALTEGMGGGSAVLISKAFLDFCTAAIFATSIGYITGFIALPQGCIMLVLYFLAGVILPHTNEVMQGDFSAVGGLITLASAFRISKIKEFKVANLLPALIVAMPLSWLWNLWM